MNRQPNLDHITGIYTEVTQVAKVTRYVVAEMGIDEVPEFPNIIFKGWCKDPADGSTWKTEWCPWKPGMLDRWLGLHECNWLRIMRWEVQRGRYRDDMEQVRP